MIELVVIIGIPNDIDISKSNFNSLSWLLPCFAPCPVFAPCFKIHFVAVFILVWRGSMVMLVLVSECCIRSSCSSMAQHQLQLHILFKEGKS